MLETSFKFLKKKIFFRSDFQIVPFLNKKGKLPLFKKHCLAYLLYLLVRLISFPSVFKLLLILCGKKSSVNPIYCPFLLYCRCCSDRQSGHIYLEGQLNSQKILHSPHWYIWNSCQVCFKKSKSFLTL